MANWFLGRALAEEAETENAPWSFLGEGVTFWVTVAVLLVVGVAVYLVTRKKGSKKSFWTAKTMAVGAMCMALSSVLSLIKLWSMPMGGSVTPASMLTLLLFAYCYGVGPGMVLGALYGVMQFLLDGMVYSASELTRSTGLPVLGALASDRTKKAGKLDAKLYQMEGRPDGSADAEMLCLMAQTIRSRAPEAKNILVTGDLPADQLEALAAALQATEPLRGQSVTAAESILKAAATVPHVVAADAIVLAADCTVTRTDAVREQNEKIVRLGKQILGCIVYE